MATNLQVRKKILIENLKEKYQQEYINHFESNETMIKYLNTMTFYAKANMLAFNESELERFCVNELEKQFK